MDDILVGHSYGGAIITTAGNNPKVAGLVFIAAHSPRYISFKNFKSSSKWF